MAKGFTVAYFISPKGEIIHCPIRHISMIISYPEKFGFNKEFIEFIYNQYNEKIGQEGKARMQLLTALFKEGWIRIRRYGDNFWSINVRKLTSKVKSYLKKWAIMMLKGTGDFKEYDKEMVVKIDQENKKVQTSNISSIADDKFIVENYKYNVVLKNIEDLEDLPLCNIVYEMMNKNIIDKIEKYIEGR